MVMSPVSLANHVQSVINKTVAQAVIDATAPNTIPTSNKWFIGNANSAASPTIAAATYGAGQGQNKNPVAAVGLSIPAALVNLQNEVASQTTITNWN
jgi:hypothetical protein